MTFFCETNDFSNMKILVVGDIILDETVSVGVNRVSPEAPVLVANFIEDKIEAGGAANVALNVISTGAKCSIIGFLGDDDKAAEVSNQLKESMFQDLIIQLPKTPSVLKTRLSNGNTQLIRLDKDVNYHEHDKKIISQLKKHIKNYDAIIVSDYGKGTITDSVFEEIERLSKQNSIKVFVDPKGSRPEKYRGATTITPNRKEFEIFVGEAETFEDMAFKGKELIANLDLDFLLVTMSELGMLLIYRDGQFEHIPTSAKEIYDVTGAGDTVIAIFATLLSATDNVVLSAKGANLAAGIVVGRSGAAKLSPLDFENILKGPSSIILTLDQLQRSRKKLGKIVMTNGCFDILHRGHVEYLSRAKSLGDTLIVALNSDASVGALKGNGRPFNKIEDRAFMLMNLKAVDFVMVFDETTPLELYNEIIPDVLVKGGDYKLSQVVGRDVVEKNGGEVIIIEYLNGYSTTKVLEKIANNEKRIGK